MAKYPLKKQDVNCLYRAFDSTHTSSIHFFSFVCSGQALGSMDGFLDPVAAVSSVGQCAQGQYGEECEYTCHCPVGTECDPLTGRCPDKCAPGWSGAPYCQAGRSWSLHNKVPIIRPLRTDLIVVLIAKWSL